MMCNKEELDETVRNYPDLHDKGNNDLKKAPDARKSNVVAFFRFFCFYFVSVSSYGDDVFFSQLQEYP